MTPPLTTTRGRNEKWRGSQGLTNPQKKGKGATTVGSVSFPGSGHDLLGGQPRSVVPGGKAQMSRRQRYKEFRKQRSETKALGRRRGRPTKVFVNYQRSERRRITSGQSGRCSSRNREKSLNLPGSERLLETAQAA